MASRQHRRWVVLWHDGSVEGAMRLALVAKGWHVCCHVADASCVHVACSFMLCCTHVACMLHVTLRHVACMLHACSTSWLHAFYVACMLHADHVACCMQCHAVLHAMPHATPRASSPCGTACCIVGCILVRISYCPVARSRLHTARPDTRQSAVVHQSCGLRCRVRCGITPPAAAFQPWCHGCPAAGRPHRSVGSRRSSCIHRLP